mgnify:CR=1 FL=1
MINAGGGGILSPYRVLVPNMEWRSSEPGERSSDKAVDLVVKVFDLEAPSLEDDCPLFPNFRAILTFIAA